MSLVFRSLAFLFALLLMAMGGVAILVQALGILDPVSFKMADDLDPFGTPPSRAGLLIGCFVSAAVCAGGAWLALYMIFFGGGRASLIPSFHLPVHLPPFNPPFCYGRIRWH